MGVTVDEARHNNTAMRIKFFCIGIGNFKFLTRIDSDDLIAINCYGAIFDVRMSFVARNNTTVHNKQHGNPFATCRRSATAYKMTDVPSPTLRSDVSEGSPTSLYCKAFLALKSVLQTVSY